MVFSNSWIVLPKIKNKNSSTATSPNNSRIFYGDFSPSDSLLSHWVYASASNFHGVRGIDYFYRVYYYYYYYFAIMVDISECKWCNQSRHVLSVSRTSDVRPFTQQTSVFVQTTMNNLLPISRGSNACHPFAMVKRIYNLYSWLDHENLSMMNSRCNLRPYTSDLCS